MAGSLAMVNRSPTAVCSMVMCSSASSMVVDGRQLDGDVLVNISLVVDDRVLDDDVLINISLVVDGRQLHGGTLLVDVSVAVNGYLVDGGRLLVDVSLAVNGHLVDGGGSCSSTTSAWQSTAIWQCSSGS